MGKGFILIANIHNDQVNLIARNNLETVSAGDIMKDITMKLNGNGGGSKTFAQGAGKDISEIDRILQEAKATFYE